MRSGILGGTFDPIHLGHLAAGEAALSNAGLDRVLFMPAGDPWQKSNRRITGAAQRAEMVALAIEANTDFVLDLREVSRDGPTYTIDTLESFDRSEELHLIVGADTAIGIPSWHRAEDVVRRATILVVPRGGVEAWLVSESVPDAVFIDMEPVDISATRIRHLVSTGKAFEHLVPPEVAEYIRRHGLYADRIEDDRVGFSFDLEEQP